MPIYNDEKNCFNCCPQCGASDDDIDWGHFESDDPPYQEGTCKKCGCEFEEVYTYANTVYNHKMDVGDRLDLGKEIGEKERKLYNATMAMEKHMDECDCNTPVKYDFSNMIGGDGELAIYCLNCGGYIEISE